MGTDLRADLAADRAAIIKVLAEAGIHPPAPWRASYDALLAVLTRAIREGKVRGIPQPHEEKPT